MLPRLASRITPAAPVVRIGDACYSTAGQHADFCSLLVCQYTLALTLTLWQFLVCWRITYVNGRIRVHIQPQRRQSVRALGTACSTAEH